MKIDTILAVYDLYEANVFNITDKYQDVSIHDYLKQFAENLPGQHRGPFIKKITNLLVNDDRFHYAVRELPAGAPDWAQRALASEQLFAFKPSEELNDTLQHITHYLSAAAEDAVKSPSPDQKIVAQRELDAFPKAENIDVIKKKSDIFFTRGSRKAARDTTGLEKIFDSGEDYIWYKLTDAAAFQREGKVLQNCIGTIYTKERIDKDKQAIAVLKNPSNESVAAMRIQVDKREILEVKGKNNKPPIEKYMIPTIKFINHMKLEPSDHATHDLQRAGYYYDEPEKQILTRPQAIQKFVKSEPIAEVGGGLTLAKSTVTNDDLFDYLYVNLVSHHRYRYIGNGRHPQIYDLRDASNTPVVTALVKDNKLVSLTSHRQQPGAVQEAAVHQEPQVSSTSLILIKELLKRGVITSMEKGIQRQLLWQDKVRWDPATKEFGELVSSEKDIDTDKAHVKWKAFTDRTTLKQLFSSLQSDADDLEGPVGDYSLKDIERIYVDSKTEIGSKDEDDDDDDDDDSESQVTYMVLKTKDGAALPIRAVFKGGDSQVLANNAGFKGVSSYTRGNRDQRAVNSLIALANKENLSLPKSVQLNHGIIRSNDKYKQYDPKFEKVVGKTTAAKLDLSNLSPGDRLAALSYVTSSSHIVDIGTSPRGSDVLTIADSVARLGNKAKHYYGTDTKSDISKWTKGELKDVYNELFKGGTPETLYVVDVKYGADKKTRTTLLVDGKKIIRVDSNTAGEKWQKWSDYDTVARQLNQFADEHGFTYEPQALVPLHAKKPTSAEHSSELRVAGGKVTTAANMKKQDIEAARQKGRFQMEGTDELKFADGAKLERMDPVDQATWIRQTMHGHGGGKGEAWKIFNKEGNAVAIIVVERGNVTAMYGKWAAAAPAASAQAAIGMRGIVSSLLPYVKKAAETFGWKSASNAMTIKKDSKVHGDLQAVERSGARRRSYLRNTERLLLSLGMLIKGPNPFAARRYGASNYLLVTAQGKALLQKLKTKDVGVLDSFTSAELPKEFVAPTRRVLPPKAKGKWAVSTATPRVGSKAESALEKFKKITDDTGTMPTRGAFMQILMAPPFGMSKLGAQTYYYTTKAKYAAIGESFSALAAWELRHDPFFGSFSRFLVG